MAAEHQTLRSLAPRGVAKASFKRRHQKRGKDGRAASAASSSAVAAASSHSSAWKSTRGNVKNSAATTSSGGGGGRLGRSGSKRKGATAGPQWFDLPRTRLTPSLKADFQVLRARAELDPTRHYVRDSKRKAVPAHCHMGTVIAGALESRHSGVLTKKLRGQTLAEEIMKDKAVIKHVRARASKVCLHASTRHIGDSETRRPRRHGHQRSNSTRK